MYLTESNDTKSSTVEGSKNQHENLIEEHEFEKLTSYQYHNMMERLKADLIAQ